MAGVGVVMTGGHHRRSRARLVTLSAALAGLVVFALVPTAASATTSGSAPQSGRHPAAASAPAKPGYVTAAAGNGTALVYWWPGSDNGAPITGWVVTPYNGTVALPARTFTTAASSELVTGLTNGTTYSFRVAAINGVGTGPQSGPSAPITVGAPAIPGSVTAIAGDGLVQVTWTKPGYSGAAALTGYTVTPYRGGVAQTPILYKAGFTLQVLSGLANGSSYRFTVAARNSFGTGPASAPTAAVTPHPSVVVPGAPTSVLAIPSNSQAVVGWTAPTNIGDSPIVAYDVEVSSGSVVVSSWEFGSPFTRQTVTGLTNGTTYVFTVRAVNGAGPGPSSTPSNPATPH